MSVSQDFKDVLDSDTSLMTLLTGGLFTFDETGYMGVSYTNTPSAFNGAMLQPCGVVKVRAKQATNDLRDEDKKVSSYTQVLEVWLYEANSTDTIEQAADLVYTLLQDSTAVEGMRTFFVRSFEGSEAPELGGALFITLEFQINSIKGL